MPASHHKKRTRHRPSGGDGRGFLISGRNSVRECLHSPHVKIHKLLWQARSRPLDAWLPEGWNARGIPVETVTDKGAVPPELHQGVGAWVDPPHWPDLDLLLDRVQSEGKTPFLLILDGVEDPMNLGQIIRTAEAAGVHAILHPDRRSSSLTQIAAQTSQGAFAWLPVLEVGNLRQCLDRLKQKGLWTVGFENIQGSRPWHQLDYTVPLVLVMGSEGRGIRDLTAKTCDFLAHFPMAGHLTSLNVSAATAAALWEVVRQRGFQPS